MQASLGRFWGSSLGARGADVPLRVPLKNKGFGVWSNIGVLIITYTILGFFIITIL